MAFRNIRKKSSSKEAVLAVEPAKASSFIDSGCELAGELQFRDDVQIDGKIEGQVEAQKAVVVGRTGIIDASVVCESVVIYGRVDGDISASRQITFHKGARVNGQMTASSIVIEEGAKFEGCIVIGADSPAAEPAALPPGADPKTDSKHEK